MMPNKDLSLLLTILAAEEATLKRTYQRRLKSMLSRYDSDDLFGDIQLRAIRDWDKCTSSDVEGVRKWVRVIARNTTMTALAVHIGRAKRSVKREVMGSPSAEFNEYANLHECATHDDGDQVDMEELLQVCMEAVEKLPARQSKAVQRRYLDDVDYQNIATEMEVSSGAVRTLVSRGIAKCRESIDQFSELPTEGITTNDQTNDAKKVE